MLRRVALLALTLSACRAAAPGPHDTTRAWAQALRESRFDDAHAMLAPRARAAVSPADFERLARQRPDEVRAAADRADSVDPASPLVATVTLADGTALRLRWEDNAWRLDPASLEFYGQHTPVAALRSFARAVERGRWDVLLRLAPREVAAQMRMAARDGATPEDTLRDAWSGARAEHDREVLRRLVEALDRGATPDVHDGRATLTYGVANRYVARLVREDGVWKVERPD